MLPPEKKIIVEQKLVVLEKLGGSLLVMKPLHSHFTYKLPWSGDIHVHMNFINYDIMTLSHYDIMTHYLGTRHYTSCLETNSNDRLRGVDVAKMKYNKLLFIIIILIP